MKDPPVREDGLCVVCLSERRPNRSAKYGRDEAERDPFCSTVCCRAWHGQQLTGTHHVETDDVEPDDELMPLRKKVAR